MAHPPRSPPGQYRVLPKPRVGPTSWIGLGVLLLAVGPLMKWIEQQTSVPRAPLIRADMAHTQGDDKGLRLVVHIQTSGFFIEGADAILAPQDRRIWCEEDRCNEQDMRLLTDRLATIKVAHPGSDHVVFVAGMTVPFGRVQAAMDAARKDHWSNPSAGEEPGWLFPRVTVQPDPLSEDRFLHRPDPWTARL